MSVSLEQLMSNQLELIKEIGAGKMLQKHTLNSNQNEMGYPLHELAFFQDCALDKDVINATVQPVYSLLNAIPARPTRVKDQKHGFLTGVDTSPINAVEPDFPCDDPDILNDNYSWCKMNYPLGRNYKRSKTGEIDDLITKACAYQYDDFEFWGLLHGRTATNGLQLTMADSELIKAASVQRKISELGRYFQHWMLDKVWTGDPVNNTANGGYGEFYGLQRLIVDSYSASGLPLESASGNLADCDALSADLKDFESTCIGQLNATTGVGIYQYMQELEDTLFQRALHMGYSNVRWVWVMHPTQWTELTKTLPCEMLADGCAAGATDGLGAMQIAMREEMRRTMSLDINGRSHFVILDSFLPTVVAGAAPAVTTTADMWLIPMAVDGKETLWMEHVDYSVVSQTLAPVAGAFDLIQGNIDSKFLGKVNQDENFCFDIRFKVEPRLKFTAPMLAGRIQNVLACHLQAKPQPALGI